MATPSAILSVLVEANAAAASATLSKFDKQLAVVNDVAKKGIDARLGGTLNSEAFTAYDEKLARAARIAKDRGAFKAQLGANFNNTAFNAYERSVDKANRSTATTTEHVGKLRNSFKSLATGILAAGGAFAAFEAAKGAIDSTVELGHATERLSAITGLDVQTASKWIEIMQVRGVQTRQTSQAFITLSKNIQNAQDGSKKAVEAFNALGVSQDVLKSGNPSAVIAAVADGLQRTVDPATRAAFAQQLFGRGAQGLIPVLKDGSKGIDEALAAAQRYGAFLPGTAKQLAGAVDAQHNLNLAMAGLKISFTQAVLPSLVQGAQKLLGFIAQMRDGKGAGGQFASAISTAFNTVKSVVSTVTGAVGGLGNAIKLAIAAFVATRIWAVVTAIKAMNLAMKTSPVGVFIAVIGGLATALGLLSSKQHQAAVSANDVADAWDRARDAARGLRDAHLAIVQARLDDIRASQSQRQAQDAATRALDRFGRNSPQYRNAYLQLEQANLDLTQASNALHDATQNVSSAQRQQTNAYNDAIKTDEARIATLRDQLYQLSANGAGARALAAKTQQLGGAVRRLRGDQQGLNSALAALPSQVKSTVTVAFNIGSAASIVNTFTRAGKLIAQAFNFKEPGLGLTGVSPLTKGPPSWFTPAKPHHRAVAAAHQYLDPFTGQYALMTSQQASKLRDRYIQTYGRAPSTRSAAAAAGAAAKIPTPPAPTPIPSQLVGAQIRMAELANQLASAQNAANVSGQKHALSAELALEHTWLMKDKGALDRVNSALRDGHVSLAKHKQLLQDKLALLQEIGTVISNIGQTQQSLGQVAGVGGTVPKVYYHDHPRTGRSGSPEGLVRAGAGEGIRKGGLTINGGLHVHGSGASPQRIVNDFYLQVRPYLTAPA